MNQCPKCGCHLNEDDYTKSDLMLYEVVGVVFDDYSKLLSFQMPRQLAQAAVILQNQLEGQTRTVDKAQEILEKIGGDDLVRKFKEATKG